MSENESVIELKGRQIVELPPIHPLASDIHQFGVSLDNEEAQVFLDNECKVLGDSDGPFLVIRVKGMIRPFVMDRNNVDVTFRPRPWFFHGQSGVICYLERIL